MREKVVQKLSQNRCTNIISLTIMRKVSSFSRIFLARIKIEGILVQDMYGYAQLF